MNEHSITLLVFLAVIVILASLLFAAGRGYLAALAKFGEVSTTLSKVLAGNHEIEATLSQHGRVLYDAHKKIHAVSKGLEKRPS